ncbi:MULTISPECIES: ABC transporter permease [unclassified Saccharicrinis]|uniref:ABC transporter permease n=1 Tax=unclassified Saccharicrinis TaxID=2646859 RepID=UPI003D34FDE5
MIALKLAYKNLMGAGLRTFLNVSVLSFAFVLIIFYNGMIDGWNRQGRNDTQDWEIGQGQFWHPGYDKYDPYTIKESHALLSEEVNSLIKERKVTPVLISQATIYPQGRLQSIVLKGVEPFQQILKLPTADLYNVQDEYSAIIGKRMAENTKLKAGDKVLVRWRDKNGTFDAREIYIASVFQCNVPSIDHGQIYIQLGVLQKMTDLTNEATLLVVGEKYEGGDITGWLFKDPDELLADFDKLIKSKKAGGTILQAVLLTIALLAIFDTQVLSIFRRQKEIGTHIALGMTRAQVVGIFTVEGAAHSILAAMAGAIYGIPLFMYINTKGISFGSQDMGLTIADTIYPYYSLGLIIGTLILVVIAATIVSYIPAKKISKMNPTDALKGKIA